MISNNNLLSGIYRGILLRQDDPNTVRVYIPGILNGNICPIDSNNKIIDSIYNEYRVTFHKARWCLFDLLPTLYEEGMPCWVMFENGDARYPVVLWYNITDESASPSEGGSGSVDSVPQSTTEPNNPIDIPTGELEYLGTFEITYYCAEEYPHICNAGPPYSTASGAKLTPYLTCAVDKTVIKFGTNLVIDPYNKSSAIVQKIRNSVWTAQDTGGAIKGNKIDLAVQKHDEAMSLGRNKNIEVYVRR